MVVLSKIESAVSYFSACEQLKFFSCAYIAPSPSFTLNAHTIPLCCVCVFQLALCSLLPSW